VRSLQTSPRTFFEAAPSVFGEGSKASHNPTDVEQAIGLECLQLLGQLHGVDVFNMGPLLITKPGTVEDPTLVPPYALGGS
jgi:cytochrome c oxidase subunit 5b